MSVLTNMVWSVDADYDARSLSPAHATGKENEEQKGTYRRRRFLCTKPLSSSVSRARIARCALTDVPAHVHSVREAPYACADLVSREQVNIVAVLLFLPVKPEPGSRHRIGPHLPV